ncbi:hypothetical protein BU14_0048s0005 [Porphyra umbilicalis]|uniref:NB-ARC domain-containing protein n=1 Tax=Porphyra umbilicalis TaxID=2786 RepID=A0A1X6PID0_PORUM|nr:hypothetical protein BU14_0048s0005 [Porphyra umbilicalis]|eukprot:OSX80590.1 hypothetical protein BU14_0048s0005 [Porphyra umbilicalis]
MASTVAASSSVPTAVGASACGDYGLPSDEDTAAWAALMRPCVGHLQQIKPAGMVARVSRLADKVTLTAVSVWLHCGLHYQLRPMANPECTPPVAGSMPPVNQPEKGCCFFPLRRDESGVACWEVRVFCASPTGQLPAVAGRWVIELVHLPNRGDPLRFCAASQADAREWHRQLRMRAAPLVLLWTRHVGVAGSGGDGCDGIGPALGRPAAARRLLVMDALTRGAGHLVATGALEGVTGVAEFVADVTQKEASNLAAAAGPVVGVALQSVCFAARVFAAAQGVFEAAAQASADVDDLHGVCRRLLVALKDVRDDADVGAAELLLLLSRLLADIEAAAGELHHLVRSRRQRAWLSCSASCRGVEVGSDLGDRLSQSRRSADGLLDELVVALQRQTAVDTGHILAAVGPEAQLAAATRAGWQGLPELPEDNSIFNDWDDPTLPAARLYDAVMQSGATASAVVGAHGMGGGGKTLTCLLVAHKVSLEGDGQLRFPDGVHWTQLSRNFGLGDVRAQLCLLATTLSGELVDAIDLELAIKRLKAVVKNKACLVILDDVWHEPRAAPFVRALADSKRSSLLLSSRHVDVISACGRGRNVLCVEVSERHGTDAERVLLTHAERGDVFAKDKTVERVRRAVELCGRLPLALAVFGSLVRGYAQKSPHEGGWAAALNQVGSHQGSLLTQPSGVDVEYGCLSDCLRASYTALREDDDDRPLRVQYFRALCVVRSKEPLPWPALAALWNVESRAAVAVIARDFHARSLVSLRGLGPGETLSLSLHDLVIDFLAAVFEIDSTGQAACHKLLVERYCQRNGIAAAGEKVSLGRTRVALRPLWLLPPDGYVERALPRLLVAAGDADELDLLLLDMRFIASRVEVAGGHCGLYRSDCRHAVGMAVLGDVASVVEVAVVTSGRPLGARLQQAAWEVAARFGSLLADGAAEADRPALNYLCESARAYLVSPFVELLGASRLLVPQERRVLPVSNSVRHMCAGFKESGGLFVVTALGLDRVPTILNVWDEESEAGVTAMEGHVGEVDYLAVVGGGASGTPQLVISGAGCALRLWDTEHWSCVAVLEGHTKPVCCATMVGACESDTPARLVSGSRDGTVRVWDTERWSAGSVTVLKGHTEMVTCLAVVSHGQCRSRVLLASGSRDKTVRVWDLNDGKCVAVLEGHADKVTSMVVVGGHRSGTPVHVVSGSVDRTLRVWGEAERWSCVAVMEGHTKSVDHVAVVRSGACKEPTWVVSASRGFAADCNALRVWDSKDWSCVAFLEGHSRSITGLSVVDDDTFASPRVVSASKDKTLRVWDVAAKSCVSVLEGHVNPVSGLAVASGRSFGTPALVISWAYTDKVRMWNLAGRSTRVASSPPARAIQSLREMGDGGHDGAAMQLMVVSDEFNVQVWDTDTWSQVAVMPWRPYSYRGIAVFDCNGCGVPTHVVVSLMRTLSVVSMDGTCVAEWCGHTSRITDVAMVSGADGRAAGRVLSASIDMTVRVWDMGSGACLDVIHFSDHVKQLAVLDAGKSGSPVRFAAVVGPDAGDGQHVLHVKCLGQASTRILGGAQRRNFESIVAVGGGASGCAPYLVSSFYDGTVQVWDWERASCLHVFKEPVSWRRCASWWPRPPVGSGRPSRVLGSGGAAAVNDAAAAGGSAAAFEDAAVLIDTMGSCALVDCRQLTLRWLPGPPDAASVCCLHGGRLAWGLRKGEVYGGQISL